MMHMGAEHIARAGLTFKNNCELVFPSLNITLAVKNFPHPKEATEQVEVSYGNGTVNLAGKTKVDGSIDVTLREFWNGDIVDQLRAWRKRVIDPVTRKAGHPMDYKLNGYVKRYNPDGSERETEYIEGAWPMSLDLGEVDYEAGDPVEVTMSLSIDKTYAESEKGGLKISAQVGGVPSLQGITGVATGKITDAVGSATGGILA
jgi:hypothetical protein